MLLVTLTRIVNGYRIIAAAPGCAATYQWSLHRNGALVCPPIGGAWLDNAVCFDLHEPLAPGDYRLHFSAFTANTSPELSSKASTALVIKVKGKSASLLWY